MSGEDQKGKSKTSDIEGTQTTHFTLIHQAGESLPERSKKKARLMG